MAAAWIDHALSLRATAFVATLALTLAWETLRPRRVLQDSRALRWRTNMALVALGAAVARLLPLLPPLALAALCQERGWGLLPAVAPSAPLAIAATLIALDLAVYAQHVVFHLLPPLWRLHRVHHTDLDFDATTAVRFHPVEIVISQFWKLAVIVALGAPPLAVLLFEILLNSAALFNHSNASLPAPLERLARLLLVTPDMHRVHHSTVRAECDSNFGFCLPWWDRVFGTYRAQPAAGHDAMTIGVMQERAPERLRLGRLLYLPFTRGAAAPPGA